MTPGSPESQPAHDPIEIPERFARALVDREGDAGRSWLSSLPTLVDGLLRHWRCTPTAPISRGGVGIILPVRRHDHTPAVLKVSFPHPGNVHEPEALATWRGSGAVSLYERDDDRFAMLLEQAEWQTLDELEGVDVATAIAGRLARRLAVAAPVGLPRLTDEVETWERDLHRDAEALGYPLSGHALGAAAATLRELGRDQPETMVHGDLHFGNVVRAEREPWLVVDPKGWVGDLAFDTLTVLVRGVETLRTADRVDTELLRRIAIFSEAAGIERERACRWVQARTVTGAHRSRKVGDPAWIVQLLDLCAESLADC